MKKKIFALSLIIPIVLILAVYSSSKVAGITVDVPVTSISIANKNGGMIEIDLAHDDEAYLDVRIKPALAKNKGYTASVEAVEQNDYCGINVDTDSGKLTADGLGRAKVTVCSNDGAFKDSAIVFVTSSKPVSFLPEITDGEGNYIELRNSDGFTAAIETGIEGLCFGGRIYPSALSHSDVEWSSDNLDVLKIEKYSGIAKAGFSGQAEITAKISDAVNGEIIERITVDVIPSNGSLLINGKSSAAGKEVTVKALQNSDDVTLIAESIGVSGGKILVKEGNAVIKNQLEASAGKYKFTLSFNGDRSDVESVELIEDGTAFCQKIKVVFEPFTFNLRTVYDTDSSDGFYHKQGVSSKYFAVPTVDSEGITYQWTSLNEEVIKVADSNDAVALESCSRGKNILMVKAFKNGEYLCERQAEIEVVENISAVNFVEASQVYGIGEKFVLGGYALENGVYGSYLHKLTLILNKNGNLCEYSGNDFDFVLTGSDASYFTDSNGLKIRAEGDGEVTVTAGWKYSDYFKDNINASFTFTAVKEAVNVFDYGTLRKAAADGKKIAVQQDIMLGRKTASVAELNTYVNKLPTSFDWTYHKNIGKERPEIMYIIEFKNDVYGNGYELNAGYIAAAKDRTGKPLLFKGPIDFIAMPTAAVKGQDNVCFLVRTNETVIDNVSLKGCSDEDIRSGDGTDLSKLNYVGTTLEIASDAVIKNCRISNGRTTVRIFGGGTTNGNPIVTDVTAVSIKDERVTTKIESSILSNAREFILKIGTNRAVSATGDTEAEFKVPSLCKEDGTPYNRFADNLSDDYFVSHYLLTDVTLKNSTLYNSGLFAIAMDTHFNGPMLNGFADPIFRFNGWKNIAATSFASVLRLEGDVKILDWKKLSAVDSSTIIETYAGVEDYLKFDIPSMINKVFKVGEEKFKNILSIIGNEKFVHGGIACFGGGKNYSVLDISGFTGDTSFNNYRVNVSILGEGEKPGSILHLQGKLLPQAAGTEDFRFYMYGADSTFSAEQQRRMLDDGSAFDIPPAA